MIALDLSALAAPVSAETRAFTDALRARLADAPKPFELPPEVTRKARAEGKGVFPALGPTAPAEWRSIPGAPGGPARVRLCPPAEGAQTRGAYLHIHGGGWTFGAPELFDESNLRIARETGLTVVSAAYRLAPEHPWPACAEDVEAAALWALEAFDGPVIVGGESAGAHLAVVALQRLRAHGLLDRVAGAALTYGAYDLRGAPSAQRGGEDDPILGPAALRWFTDNLTGGDPSLTWDPALSPLLGDLSGFPPAQILIGTADPLLDDNLLMAARLTALGAEVETLLFPGAIHGFDQLPGHPLAEAANAARTGFLRRIAARVNR